MCSRADCRECKIRCSRSAYRRLSAFKAYEITAILKHDTLYIGSDFYGEGRKERGLLVRVKRKGREGRIYNGWEDRRGGIRKGEKGGWKVREREDREDASEVTTLWHYTNLFIIIIIIILYPR